MTPGEIKPGQISVVGIHGSPDEDIQLLAYSRPNTTYGIVREGTTDENGDLRFSVTPGTNTRLFARYAQGGNADLDSGSKVILVHTALSLSAYRDGVRQYHFQGTNLPRRAGQLITLYRYARQGSNTFCDPHPAPGDLTGASTDATCIPIRTAIAKTNATNVWRIDRTFTGSGQFVFVVRSGQNLTNAAGVSNFRLTVIH